MTRKLNLSPELKARMVAQARSLGPEMLQYWHYHRQRFFFCATLLQDLLDRRFPSAIQDCRLLDVGPSFQTLLFHELWPQMRIDTMGLEDPKFPPPRAGRHIPFNFDEVRDRNQWPQEQPYDVITHFEVLEHLYAPPTLVLCCLNSLLKEKGFLILQTPNALALQKRLCMLRGNHPYSMIHEDPAQQGHIREYTRDEITQIGRLVGLVPRRIILSNLYSSGSPASRLFNRLSPLLPASWRKTITAVFEKA